MLHLASRGVMTRSIVVAITGASGTPYAIRLLEALAPRDDIHVDLVLSRTGAKLVSFEAKDDLERVHSLAERVWDNDDFFAPVASGSHRFAGMVVIPASMKHVGLMAHGIGDDLIARTADVCLKERRTLVLVPRETPLSSIHLRNLLTLSEAGAHIVPAMPGFYTHPKTLDDVVAHVAGKALDAMGIDDHDLYPRWRETPE